MEHRKRLRVTQRRPLACNACTAKKVKCDKTLPCSRCLKSGIECTRELVRVSHAVSKHRNEIGFLQSVLDDLEGGQASDVLTQKLRRRITTLDSGLGEDEVDAALAASTHSPTDLRRQSLPSPSNWHNAAPLTHRRNQVEESQDRLEPGESDKEEETALSVAVLENLAWGRHYGGCYPHRGCACYFHRSQSEMNSINADPGRMRGRYSASLDDYGVHLTDAEARKLVQFHIEYIAWHHNAIHSLTFMTQCENFWKTGRIEHPLWMALYLSVLSTAVWCSQNSERFQTLLCMRLAPNLAVDLWAAMMDVLASGRYTENLSIFTIQAIVISTEVAHNLGKSESNAVLVAAAVRIAQCLGLHKISDTPQPGILSADTWYGRVEREVGKRLWCILRIQDHFAIYFTDSYVIHTLYFSTSLPANCDDHDLEPRSPDTPTISSYTRSLVQIAALIPELMDSLAAVRTQSLTLNEKYELVLRADQRMRQLVATIPSFLLQEQSREVLVDCPWVDVARHSLTVTAADKIIMIHRPFLVQSFTSPQYHYTRSTCVAAATTLLRAHEQIYLADDISIWTHSAFCVTAAIVLSLELLYRQPAGSGFHDSTVEQRDMYMTLILRTRDRLLERKNDLVAERAARLIAACLEMERMIRSEEAMQALNRSPRVDHFHEIISRFLGTGISDDDWAGPGSNPLAGKDDALHEQLGGDSVGVGLTSTDFDIWFDHYFGSVL